MMEHSTQPQIESPERKLFDALDKSLYCDLWPLSDGNICTDDGFIFHIHRVILARSSEYFRILFLGRNNLRSEVSIPGITGDILSNILIYLYTGQVQVTETNLTELLVGSHYLMLSDLYTLVKSNIKDCLTYYNCFRLLHTAFLINDEWIFQKCFRFIQTKFQRVCRQKDDLVELPLEILWKLLRCTSLNVDSESTVWQVIVDWTERDISNRSDHVHQLLLSLASEEIGEELATEILNHAIVSENAFIRTARRNKSLTNSLALLQSIMCELTYDNSKLYSFRVPPRLHFILSRTGSSPTSVNFYYSYDENFDLWMKTTYTDFTNRPDVIIANHQRIYVFEMFENQCKYIRLDTMEWMAIEGFRNRYRRHSTSVVTIGKYIYILGRTYINQRGLEYAVEVLDTENNIWSAVVAPRNVRHGKAVTVCGKIYVLKVNTSEVTFQVFDPDTQQWSFLPITSIYPNIHCEISVCLSYHQKIYVISSDSYSSNVSNTKVFDPKTNTWKKLVDLPFRFTFIHRAVTFEDKIFVYGYSEAYKTSNLLWNEEMERWEEANNPFLNKPDLKYCTIEDAETSKLIKRQKRDPKLTLDEVLSRSNS